MPWRQRAQGVHNVTFERADAQVCRFPQERFDLAISRFGTMFFADPAAAARALRRLRETLAAHMSGDGVWFGSRAWTVTARRC